MKKAKLGKRKREVEDVGGFIVLDRRAYFSDYLENEVGAKWHLIKRTLYDAGYTTEAVGAYRDGLLSDFRALCSERGYTAYI